MANNNVFESLREEERSEESSEMGDSTADFLVQDEPLRDEPTAGQGPVILEEENTLIDGSVSIYRVS